MTFENMMIWGTYFMQFYDFMKFYYFSFYSGMIFGFSNLMILDFIILTFKNSDDVILILGFLVSDTVMLGSLRGSHFPNMTVNFSLTWLEVKTLQSSGSQSVGHLRTSENRDIYITIPNNSTITARK